MVFLIVGGSTMNGFLALVLACQTLRLIAGDAEPVQVNSSEPSVASESSGLPDSAWAALVGQHVEISLKTGEIVTGTVLSHEGEDVVLSSAEGAVVAYPKATVLNARLAPMRAMTDAASSAQATGLVRQNDYNELPEAGSTAPAGATAPECRLDSDCQNRSICQNHECVLPERTLRTFRHSNAIVWSGVAAIVTGSLAIPVGSWAIVNAERTRGDTGNRFAAGTSAVAIGSALLISGATMIAVAKLAERRVARHRKRLSISKRRVFLVNQFQVTIR